MKICSIIGARPQFIKSAPISKAFSAKGINEIVIHTGQHFDSNMSEIFFNQLSIPRPNYNLDINSLNHGAMTGRMLEKIENLLLNINPNYVLVYGDTNSTLAGALAAAKLDIDVIHIEAGLRSFNRKMPEELNRVLTDNLSKILFCPSSQSLNNLKKEGISDTNREIYVVGDVMKDALSLIANNISNKQEVNDSILVTIHRQENVQNKSSLLSIASALNELSKNYQINFPVHPSTKKKLDEFGINLSFETMEPQGFIEMISLLSSCSVVITDSGGLQKEAYYLQKPCVIAREDTEWVELLTNNINTLVGSNSDLIISKTVEKITSTYQFDETMYGTGNAANDIADIIVTR